MNSLGSLWGLLCRRRWIIFLALRRWARAVDLEASLRRELTAKEQLEASKAQLLIAKAGRPDAAGVLECLERDGLGPNREAIDIADEEKPRRVTALSIAAQVGCAENVAVLPVVERCYAVLGE